MAIIIIILDNPEKNHLWQISNFFADQGGPSPQQRTAISSKRESLTNKPVTEVGDIWKDESGEESHQGYEQAFSEPSLNANCLIHCAKP